METMSQFVEEGKLIGGVAIVTGAGEGIGRGVALRLAREGASLVIAELNGDTAAAVAGEVEALGRRALAYPIDISDVIAVKRMVRDVISEFGRIDILVNNAAIVQVKPMLDLSEEDWDRMIAVNQRGLFFCLQAVAAQMVRQIDGGRKELVTGRGKGATATREGHDMEHEHDSRRMQKLARECHGKIVNIVSYAAHRGRPLSTHYAASKAAVLSITRSAALALATYHINVNAVYPGVVLTSMWDEIDSAYSRSLGAKAGESKLDAVQSIPLGRPCTTEDVAGCVVFLSSSDADYITGQAVNVDGGRALL